MALSMEAGNPRPHDRPRRHEPVRWSEGPCVELAGSRPNATRDLSEIVQTRRTRYGFDPLTLVDLSRLLTLSARVQLEVPSELGFPLSYRPAPSAGGIHPIHLVVHRPDSACLCRYDAFGHSLCELQTPSVQPASVRSELCQIVEGEHATLLLMVAEPGRTAAKYADHTSLVWRDAGVLLGVLAVAAEALNLNFVPLGVTGEPWASVLVEQPGLFGVGAAWVGARPGAV